MQGIYLLLLGTLVRVNVAARSEGLEDEISRFLSVECQSKEMTVSLSYNHTRHRHSMTRSVAETLSGAKLQVGNYEECRSQNNRKHEEHTVTFDYNDCGSRSEEKHFGTMYAAEVVVNIATRNRPSHLNVYMYTVGCTVLNYELGPTRFEVSRKGEALDTAEMETINMPVNSYLRMEISPTLSSVARGLEEVFTYPAKCTVSSVSDKAASVVVLDKGCPLYSGKHPLSTVYQKEALQYTASGTEVFISTINEIFPLAKPDEENRYLNLNISCDVFFCTSNPKQRIRGVPLCPSAAPCESSFRVQPLLQVGGSVRLHSAHLPLPVRVDLERDGGVPRERTSIRQPQPIFHQEPCKPPVEWSYLQLGGLILGAFFAGAAALCILQYVCRFQFQFGSVRLSSAVVSQTDHAPQPYFKLEPTPRLLSDQPIVS